MPPGGRPAASRPSRARDRTQSEGRAALRQVELVIAKGQFFHRPLPHVNARMPLPARGHEARCRIDRYHVVATEVGGALPRRRPRDRGAAVHRPAGVGRDDDVDRPVGRGEQGEVSADAEADESARPGRGVAQRVERPAHLVDHCTGIQRSQQREATLPAGLVIGQRETGLAAPE